MKKINKKKLSFQNSRITDCNLLTLPKNKINSGLISSIKENKKIDFNIKRVYYLYDIPKGIYRGEHAHKKLYQIIFALSGSFNIIIDDGYNKKTYMLDSPEKGLYVVPGIWRKLNNFSKESLCLVVASEKFSEGDYIRLYQNFIKKKHE